MKKLTLTWYALLTNGEHKELDETEVIQPPLPPHVPLWPAIWGRPMTDMDYDKKLYMEVRGVGENIAEHLARTAPRTYFEICKMKDMQKIIQQVKPSASIHLCRRIRYKIKKDKRPNTIQLQTPKPKRATRKVRRILNNQELIQKVHKQRSSWG